MKRIASLLLFLLAGCAAAPVTQGPLPVNPTYSRALNFAIAVGETDRPIGPFLIDRPAAEVAQLNPLNTTRGGEHPAVTLGYAAANAINPAPGVSHAVGAGFSALSLLTSLPTYTPGQQDQVYVWAPVERGATSDQALASAGITVRRTYVATIGQGYRLVQGSNWRDAGWFEGPACTSETCLFWLSIQPGAATPRQPIDPPAVILHQGKVYEPWRLRFGVTDSKGRVIESAAVANPSLEQLKAFSQALPDWMAVYLAPKAGRNGAPLVLYRSETLAFIQPGT